MDWNEACDRLTTALIEGRGAEWQSVTCDQVYTYVCFQDCSAFSYFAPERFLLCGTFDCPAPEFTDQFWGMLADNPFFYAELQEWRGLQVLTGQDPNDWPQFQTHLISIGAPDPGDDSPPDFYSLPYLGPLPPVEPPPATVAPTVVTPSPIKTNPPTLSACVQQGMVVGPTGACVNATASNPAFHPTKALQQQPQSTALLFAGAALVTILGAGIYVLRESGAWHPRVAARREG